MSASKLCAVVALSENRCIGRDGTMPWHIPDDLKHFRRITMGKPVIMGRKTFESIGKPLPGRANLIVSRSGFTAEGAEVFAALDDAIARAAQSGSDEIMIIGGGQIYAQSLPLLDRLYLTEVHMTVEGDTYFPALNTGEWAETDRTALPAAEGRPACDFITLDRVR